MKKVLVTGATGFIGNYIIQEFLRKGIHVVATSSSIDKAKTLPWYKQVTYIPFDLTTVSADKNYFQFFEKPDLLIHLAWEGLPNYKASFHIEQNLPRHVIFLQNMLVNGLKDLCVTGTCFEYGMQEGELSENMPANPSNEYAVAKDRLRLVLEDLQKEHSFDLKWVRLFYMFGRGQNPNSLLSQLDQALERGDESFNMSPGDQLRDYLPVETVASYMVKIALQTEVSGIINCCSGIPVTVKQLVESYLQRMKASIHLNLGYYPYNNIEPKNFWGNPDKLKKIIDHEQSS
jgi:dTDP-6-deoxy-L-talose 4-dehydrogenase (NAD+)